MDAQRADGLEGHTEAIQAKIGTRAFMVWEEHEGKGSWRGMGSWSDALRDYRGDNGRVLKTSPNILPEDNACIMFTSGTYVLDIIASRCTTDRLTCHFSTGLPKGVLNTQRMYITNILNVLASLHCLAFGSHV